jgi:hypothetical protein
LTKIHKLYANLTREKIRGIFFQTDFNVKKTIDILIRQEMESDEEETEGGVKKSKNESLSIDEWSDGDEKIRAKNKADRERKKRNSNESSASSTTTTSTTASSTTGANTKRKTEDKGRLLFLLSIEI